jgi:uridine kinase
MLLSIKCTPLIGTGAECSTLILTRKRSRAKQDLSQGNRPSSNDMVAQSPVLVGIAGGSCAGKTWLAERLQKILGENACHVSLDDFYHDRSRLSPRQRTLINFDHPRAIDWERVEKVLQRLASGNAARVPRYNFSTHGRMATEPVLSPKNVVIMDGLWLFRRASIRTLFDLKIFIRSSRQWCEEKRLERDVAQRGRTADQVRAQLEKFTLPMFERYVAPQERWADIVLQSPVSEKAVREIAEKINFFKESSVGI